MATHDNFKNFYILVSLKLNYDSGIEECANISEIKLTTVISGI